MSVVHAPEYAGYAGYKEVPRALPADDPSKGLRWNIIL